MCVIEPFVYYRKCDHILPVYRVRERCDFAKLYHRHVCSRDARDHTIQLRDEPGRCTMCRDRDVADGRGFEYDQTILHYARSLRYLQDVIAYLLREQALPLYEHTDRCPCLRTLTIICMGTLNDHSEWVRNADDWEDVMRMLEEDERPIDIETFPGMYQFMVRYNRFIEENLIPGGWPLPLLLSVPQTLPEEPRMPTVAGGLHLPPFVVSANGDSRPYGAHVNDRPNGVHVSHRPDS